MVLTKQDIQQINDTFKTQLEACFVNFNKSLDEKLVVLEGNIDQKLNKLEIKLATDLEAVKKSNTNLTLTVNNNQVHLQNELIKVDDRVTALEIGKIKDLTDSNEQLDKSVDHLSNKIVGLEKAVYTGHQHSRKWNIEIDGIPTNVGDESEQLRVAANKILTAINVQITPKDIEAIHRLHSKANPKPTIIRFNNRQTVEDLGK